MFPNYGLPEAGIARREFRQRDDIGGSFSIEGNDGTHIKIIFTYKAMGIGSVTFS
jgi:hypothetical protein